MLTTIRTLSVIRSTSRLLYKNLSTSSRLNTNYELAHDLGFRNHFSSTDNEKILNVINKCSMIEMRNFNISQMRLKKLVQKRELQGEFKSVDELLELEGFGIKILEKFCESIIQSEVKLSEDGSNQELLNQKGAKKDSFVSPALLEAVRGRITSAVSFHIDLNYFAWTKICYLPESEMNGKFYVEEWYCHEIERLDRKVNLSSMSQLLVHLIEHIPHADAYVIEAMPMVNTAQGGQAQIMVNVQKAQFYAMLCALMSARKGLNVENDQNSFIDNYFFLRSFLPSRFYKYLIGNEKVAAEQVVDIIFQYNEASNHTQQVPKYESIDVPLELKNYFKTSRSVEKEYLGNSLLVGLTFMKLCVERDSKCIELLKVKNKP